jgi:hypothetical protein
MALAFMMAMAILQSPMQQATKDHPRDQAGKYLYYAGTF